MPSPFTPRANLLFGAFVGAGVIGVVALATGAYAYMHSPYRTGVEVEISQPIPFSHEHHVAGLGLDCRYCHATVETTASAGMPPTGTCMNCHWAVWNDAEALAPVRRSWRDELPIQWQRVHDLPDFVYFDHSIHVTKGIGCRTCHGRVDQMRMVQKSEPLFMKWCLECHRDPQPFIGPRSRVFDLSFDPATQTTEQRRDLVREYNVNSKGLTDCSACHR